MATQSGAENPGLIPAHPPHLLEVEQELREHPGRFEFFQAVRLLLRIFEGREVVGRFVNPDRESVRFHAVNSLRFPPSQIQSIDWEAEMAHLFVNFMGLTGPMGVLPYKYTEYIEDQIRNRDRAMAAFFDIFNHRIISLFYRAWEKYRFPVAYERDGKDRMVGYLRSLIGLGTSGLENRLAVRDESLLFYAGLLSLGPRSATVLAQVLEDYFGVPAEVDQFAGAWQPLDPADLCTFEDEESASGQLGAAVVGDAVWEHESKVCVKLGPLTQKQYLDFLPFGSAYEPLRAITGFFCGLEVEVEVQLVLRREEVPDFEIGEDTPAGPWLGWFTWMKSGREFNRNPGDTVLTLKP